MKIKTGATAASWCLAAACGINWRPQRYILPCMPQTIPGSRRFNGAYETYAQGEAGTERCQ